MENISISQDRDLGALLDKIEEVFITVASIAIAISPLLVLL